ncbi:MAG: hypothetical protein RQ847_12075, partial [Wenzhouxiangellaceae bacterium]|nr:hypothetical protein [Wenzhouxiangellaceae bacterium]
MCFSGGRVALQNYSATDLRERGSSSPFGKLMSAKPATDFCAVENWGPRETRAGQAFNEQP